MIPLAIPNLGPLESAYVKDCLDSTFISSVGPWVTRFEESTAKASGSRFAVATSAGTTALHLGLVTLGVGRDDLVIAPSYTFIATANAIAHCGALPWLFDVAPESWTLDAALLAETLAAETVRDGDILRHRPSGRRVAAIVPVHVLGSPADMDAITALARQYRLPVVADGAAALGATYKGREPGRCGADLTMYSFNGNKTLTAGGGGILAGDDEALVRLARHLSTTARVGADYDHDRVGFNYRMTSLQAAVGCAQIERIEELVAAKRRIRQAYDDAFRDLGAATPFPQPDWSQSACWFSGFLAPDAATAIALRQGLREDGIDVRPFWKPAHLQPAFRDAPRTPQKVTDGLWQRVLTLPCSTGLTDAEQDAVIAAVRRRLA